MCDQFHVADLIQRFKFPDNHALQLNFLYLLFKSRHLYYLVLMGYLKVSTVFIRRKRLVKYL